MDRSSNHINSEYKQRFQELLAIFVEAQGIITQKLTYDVDHGVLWQQLQDRLNLMKFFIDAEEIPTHKQKIRCALSKILEERIQGGLTEAELNCLTHLEKEFNALGESLSSTI